MFFCDTTFSGWLIYPEDCAALSDKGLLSGSSENPQLLVALDTLDEPVLLTLAYGRETVSLTRVKRRIQKVPISYFLIAEASMRAML